MAQFLDHDADTWMGRSEVAPEISHRDARTPLADFFNSLLDTGGYADA